MATVFVIPKSDHEARLILDYSKITDFLDCPTFYLPSVFQLLSFLNLENKLMCKLDLKDAFFHINIHKESQYITTFSFAGKYYKFTCLPFSLSISPFFMQMFANSIAQCFRDLGANAWGHIDDFLIAHCDASVLSRIMHSVLADLVDCQVLINCKKSIVEPTRRLPALGTIFNTISNQVTISEERKLLINRIFVLMSKCTYLKVITWQRFWDIFVMSGPLCVRLGFF